MTNYLYSDSVRPQPSFQSTFKSRDRRGFDPSGAVEEFANEGVVDAGFAFDPPHTLGSNNGPKVKGEFAHDLGGRGSAGDIGPSGAAVAGRVASGPRHETSLAGTSQDSNSCAAGPLELSSTSSFGVKYPRLLSVEVQNSISNYTPKLSVDEWSPIALFVRQAVADCEFARVDTSIQAMTAVSQLARWCHEVACLDLDRDVVFHVDTIERFVAQLENLTAHTKGTYRSRLLKVAERLIGPQIASYRHKQFARSVSPDAYSVGELLDLRTVRNNQSNDYRRLNLGVFLALGAGAGLAPGEMNRLRQSHVRSHAGGYLMRVSDCLCKGVTGRSERKNICP